MLLFVLTFRGPLILKVNTSVDQFLLTTTLLNSDTYTKRNHTGDKLERLQLVRVTLPRGNAFTFGLITYNSTYKQKTKCKNVTYSRVTLTILELAFCTYDLTHTNILLLIIIIKDALTIFKSNITNLTGQIHSSNHDEVSLDNLSQNISNMIFTSLKKLCPPQIQKAVPN